MTVNGHVVEYVTASIGGQLFGLPIARVQDVFVAGAADAACRWRRRRSPGSSICAAAS